MRRIRTAMMICILMGVPAQMSAESGIPGWGKAKWGMTHAAMKKLFELNPWEPGTTPVCKAQKKIRIWGRNFAVACYFDQRSANGKLFKVVLVHFDNEKGDTTWLYSIKDTLVEKYGIPDSFEVKEKMRISQWKKTDGQLKLTTITGHTVMCALEYVAVSLEGNKL
jgi:hypothetical protein